MRGILDQLGRWVYAAEVLAAMCFVLALPLMPTGDGPVHLYYANVLRGLLAHSGGFEADYAIRHLFAPYLVHYLALISFEQLLSPPRAEELLICVIFLLTATGFRFLARALGKETTLACLWLVPLLFSWSLSGGFLNCCFATGVALWAFGVWFRLESRSLAESPGLLLAYAGTLCALVLSHPVPLLVLLLFTGADLALQALQWRGLRGHAPQLIALCLSGLAFVAPVLLAQKGQAAAVLPEMGFHLDVLLELLTGMRLTMFAGLGVGSLGGWVSLGVRVALVAIVPGVALLILRGRSRPGAHASASLTRKALLPTAASDRLLLISLLYLAATVFFPRSLNHSYFFPQRMWDIVWLLVLACGAAAPLSPRLASWLTAGALLTTLGTTVTGLPALAAIARAQAELARAPLPAGGRGVLLASASAIDEHHAATTYPVAFWSGVRTFAHSRATLLNSPWLELTILPVKNAAATSSASSPLLSQGLPFAYSENPVTLAELLLTPKTPAEQTYRATVLARATFLLYVDRTDGRTSPSPAVVQAAAEQLLGSQLPGWHCDAPSFYAVCVRRQEPASHAN